MLSAVQVDVEMEMEMEMEVEVEMEVAVSVVAEVTVVSLHQALGTQMTTTKYFSCGSKEKEEQGNI